jgi:hypothetical protein
VLGLAQSGLPRLRLASLATASHQRLAVRCRELAATMLDEQGGLLPEYSALGRELTHGWLASIASGEGSAVEAMGA